MPNKTGRMSAERNLQQHRGLLLVHLSIRIQQKRFAL